MHSSKIQDQIGAVIGTYVGPVKGKFQKSDFVVKTSKGDIKLLGIASISQFLSGVPVGATVSIKYSHTEEWSGNDGSINKKIHVIASVL